MAVFSGRVRVFGALQHYNYRLYWTGLLVSVIGWQVQNLALGWLVLRLTDSPFWLGMVAFASAVPTIALSLLGGVVADRVDKRRLLMLTQMSAATLATLLATLTATDVVGLLAILGIAVAAGIVVAFDQPARLALVPYLVSRGDLMNAIALTSAAWQVSRIIGPAIAGILVGLAGEALCFYITAVGFTVLALAFYSLKLDPTSKDVHTGGMWTDLAQGTRYVKDNPLFATLIITTLLNSVFGMSYFYMMPVFARDVLQVGSTGLGFLVGASGLGALLGTLVTASLGSFRRRGWLLLGGAAAFGIALVLFAASGSYALSLGLLGAAGLFNSLYMTTANTILQSRVPDVLRGRVMSIYSLTWSMMPLGGMVSGTIATFAGAPLAVGLGGAIVTCFALAVAVFSHHTREVS
ncbi:MAG: MFS transporter [Chloroflexi bacterium]|nr:MFS transporter [Chloroflexota bacterium]